MSEKWNNLRLLADGSLACPQCNGEGTEMDHVIDCSPDTGFGSSCPQPVSCHVCHGAAKFTAQEIRNAIGEKAACHWIFDRCLIALGHDPKKGHPMLVQAVESQSSELATLKAECERLRKALDACISEMGSQIQRKSLAFYLAEQFPATVGHIPLQNWIRNLNEALTQAKEAGK